MKRIKIQKQSWQKMAEVWKKYIKPPSRPCVFQIKSWKSIIKKEIRDTHHARALILGSTPELRDLSLDLGFHTFVVDINQPMVSAMTSLMKNKDLSKEVRIIKNWLKMDFPEYYFDLILGDASLNQVFRKQDLKNLLAKLSKFLKHKGIMLMREVVHLSKTPVIRRTKDWILWFNKYKKGVINELDLYSMFKYQSDINSFNSPSLADVTVLFYKLESADLKSKVPKKFYYFFIKAFGKPPVSKFLVVYLKKDLEKLFRQYFEITSLKSCPEHYHCQYMLQYLLKPKK